MYLCGGWKLTLHVHAHALVVGGGNGTVLDLLTTVNDCGITM